MLFSFFNYRPVNWRTLFTLSNLYSDRNNVAHCIRDNALLQCMDTRWSTRASSHDLVKDRDTYLYSRPRS